MLKASDVMGRPVIIRDGGIIAGRVKDFVIDRSGSKVLGLMIGQGMFKGAKVAPWAEMRSIGPDSVVLGSGASIAKTGEAAADIKDALDNDTKIRGLQLQTTEGKHLGVVEDFFFNESTAEVEGYEISGGVFSDALGGRSFLPVPASLELGQHVAFVDPEVETSITPSQGGIKGVFKKYE